MWLDSGVGCRSEKKAGLRVGNSLVRLLVRVPHVLRAGRRVVGPAIRRLGPDIDVDEARARIDADAHAPGVEAGDVLVQHLVVNAGDADVRGRAVKSE